MVTFNFTCPTYLSSRSKSGLGTCHQKLLFWSHFISYLVFDVASIQQEYKGSNKQLHFPINDVYPTLSFLISYLSQNKYLVPRQIFIIYSCNM